MNVVLVPELVLRADALRAIGFTIVEAQQWSFVAVRSQWHWDLAIHMTTIMSVRRAAHCTEADVRAGRQGLHALGYRWDPCRLPRGMQHARALVDLVLVDGADPGAQAFARGPVGKGFGTTLHTALVNPAGAVIVASPFFGAAFWPKVRHAIDVGASGRGQPAPTAVLGLLIALTLMYPSLLAIALCCCGIPLIVMAALLMSERPWPSALP